MTTECSEIVDATTAAKTTAAITAAAVADSASAAETAAGLSSSSSFSFAAAASSRVVHDRVKASQSGGFGRFLCFHKLHIFIQ